MEQLTQALEAYRTARARRWKALQEEESEEEQRARQGVEVLLTVHLAEALRVINIHRADDEELSFNHFSFPGQDNELTLVFSRGVQGSFYENNALFEDKMRPRIPLCEHMCVRMKFTRGL